MGNLEKYGVLALIFVIVIILTVAIFHGPAADASQGAIAKNDAAHVDQVKSTPEGGASTDLANRPAVSEFLKQQQQQQNEQAKTPIVVTPNNGAAKANENAAAENSNNLQPASKTRPYVVAKSDTLQSIAKKELGSRSRWNDIVKANEGLDPKKLRVGMTIQLPAENASVAANAEATPKAGSEKSAARGSKKSAASLSLARNK